MKTQLKIQSMLIALVLLAVSCNKDKEVEVIVSGRMIEDCTGKPVANKTVLGTVTTSAPFLMNRLFGFMTTTDADGNFSLGINKSGELDLRSSAGGEFIVDIPIIKEDVNLGTFIAFPTTSFVYRIKVNNPYNVGDTLVLNIDGLLTISNANKPLISIPAPLSDTTFELVTNYRERGTLTYDNIDKVNVKMEYAVANSNRELYFEKNNLIFPLTICPLKVDTITLIVD